MTDVLEVAGVRYHVRRSGVRGVLPAIVLEAGGGGVAAHWHWVQRALEPHTVVLSYDRAGVGSSTPAVRDLRPEAVLARLRQVMRAAEVEGPFILAGHSLGALYAQLAAASEWSGLAGVVLLDSTPSSRVPFTAAYRRKLAWLPAAQTLSAFLRQSRRVPAGLPPESQPAPVGWRHQLGVQREIASLGRVRLAVGERRPRPSVPVLSISAGLRDAVDGKAAAAFNAALVREHEDVARASDRGRHVLLPQATHASMLLDPVQAQKVAGHMLSFARSLAAPATRSA